jgi:hypothetical protein
MRWARVFFAWAVILPAVGIGWLIAWVDRHVGSLLAFPRNLEALKRRRDWCEGVLPRGVGVKEVSVAPLSSTVAFRSDSGFVEVTGDDGSKVELFAKFAPTSGSIWNRCIFNLQGNSAKETRFAALCRDGERVPAPRAYFAKHDPLTGNLCVITEKMTDAVEHREDVEAVPAAHVELALDGLARLHALWWGQPPKEVSPIPRAVVDWFDSLVAFSWGKAARKILVESWARMNAAQTVIHGDARVGNMLFPTTAGSGRFVLIDWQAVRSGMAAYDLAYFLTLSLSAQQRSQVEQRSIEAYHRKLGVSAYRLEALEEDYRHACLCVVVLLSLPLLSGEASADGAAAAVFVGGMGLWRDRLRAKMDGFDYAWVAREYGIAEGEARAAIAEMLGTIDARLKGIQLRART